MHSLPRVFHLQKQTGNNRQLQPADVVVERRLVFERGFLTPRHSRDWTARFKQELNIYNAEKLKAIVQKRLGYQLSLLGVGELGQDSAKDYLLLKGKLGEWKAAHPGEKLEGVGGALAIELAFCMLEMSYYGAVRKDGRTPAVTHPLRVGALVASVCGDDGAMLAQKDIEAVLTALLHDMVEDAFDPRSGVRFRIGMDSGWGPESFIIKGREDAKMHLGQLFGAEVLQNVMALTREPQTKQDIADWKRFYKKTYLGNLYSTSIACAFAKGFDALANLWELEGITGSAEKKGMVERSILKVAWQVKRWQKLSWFVAELLLSDIERNAAGTAYEGTHRSLRALGEPEIKKFEKGIVFVPGQRKLSDRVLGLSLCSGMPGMIVYNNGGGRFEIELAYVEDAALAQEITSMLGKSVRGIRLRESMIPGKLRRAIFLEFEADPSEIRANGAIAVRHYDKCLRAARPDLFAGFDREKWTDHARKMKDTLLQESAVSLELSERRDLAAKTFRPIHPKAKRRHYPKSTRPLEEGPVL